MDLDPDRPQLNQRKISYLQLSPAFQKFDPVIAGSVTRPIPFQAWGFLKAPTSRGAHLKILDRTYEIQCLEQTSLTIRLHPPIWELGKLTFIRLIWNDVWSP